jgi:diguanylate cyclase (GGDEF)-like protein/PAS domain S-box-containing protein
VNKPVNVLVIDDVKEHAQSAMENLRNAGFEVNHRLVRDGAEFGSALVLGHWDAVIANLEMPGLPGLDALRIFLAAELDIPFILISDMFIEEIAVSSVKAGASDYVTKDRLARLAPVLTRELEETKSRVLHRKAKRALIESEERFRSLTALSSDWYWEQDEQLRFTYVSASLRDKYSEALELWAGKTRWELPYRNADWTDHRAAVEARLPFYDVELQPFRHDGRAVYVSVSGEPKLNAQGHFLGYRGVGRDITERVKDADALRRFRAAMDATGDIIMLVDRKTMRFIEVNATAVQLLGYTRTELLTMTPAELSSTPQTQVEQAYDSLIAGEDRFRYMEGHLRRKDGSELHVAIRQNAQRAGDDWLIVGVARDETERKQAEGKLRRLNRLYAMVSATNTLVMRVRERDELFRNACVIAVQHGEFERAWIGVVDENDMMIVPKAWAGLDEKAVAALKILFSVNGDVMKGKTLAGRAIREKSAVVSREVSEDAELVHGKSYADSGIRSLAFLPLIVSDKAIGVFVLYTNQPEFFDADGLLLLTELAGNVAFAIDHLEKQERLDYLAYYDPLTGLANRRLFLDRLAQHMRSATANGHTIALFLFNLERFKKINDTLGRTAGDDLLKLVAKWLADNVGDFDVLARVDADNFAVVLPQATHESDIIRLLEKTIAAFLNHPFCLNEVDYRIAAKVGVALYPDDGADADTLFKHAEAAVKKAKMSGDRYLFYAHKMTDTVAGGLGFETRLRQALERDEFVLHYQPKVSIASGELTGAEALIRWNDPQTGLVPPARFIPVLEEIGLIQDVGRWALEKAMEDYQRWRRSGLTTVRIAVNVSPLQLRSRSFVTEVERAISTAPDSAGGLELELTESLIMENVTHSILSLSAIRALGITIAIDDFGTGFSSLSYLSKLPLDTLKIDRSFVTDMVASVDGKTLVAVIVNLAHALKLKVVAEGVETEEQLHELRLLCCEEIQGFLFGKPVPVAIFEQKYLNGPATKAWHADAGQYDLLVGDSSKTIN